MIRRRASLLIGAVGLFIFCSVVPAVSAETLGFNLSAATPNDSICRFKPTMSSLGRTESRYCSVRQSILDEDYEATDGLAPFYNSTVVGWSILVGPRSPNTGRITLALGAGGRWDSPAPVNYGPEVLLPDVPPGTLVHFDENLPIEEGGEITLRIGITTRGNAEEAGAPLAFAAPGIGRLETFLGGVGEPWSPVRHMGETTDHQALLLEVETVSSEDTTAPIARRRFAARQDLSRGALMRVRSNEAGGIRATAKLVIAGLKQSFRTKSKRITVRPNSWTSLRLPLRGTPARAVKAAEAEGRRVTLKGRVRVVDGAGNTTALPFRVKGR